MNNTLSSAQRIIVYLLIVLHGVVGLSVMLGVRLPYISSNSGNLVGIILVLLFATLLSFISFKRPPTQSQKIFAGVFTFYLLLLLVYPYTFEIPNDFLPSKSYRGLVLPLCFGVLTFGYLALTGRKSSILGLMVNGAIAIFFVEWWFYPDRLMTEYKTLALFTIVSLSIGGAIAWFLKK